MLPMNSTVKNLLGLGLELRVWYLRFRVLTLRPCWESDPERGHHGDHSLHGKS